MLISEIRIEEEKADAFVFIVLIVFLYGVVDWGTGVAVGVDA